MEDNTSLGSASSNFLTGSKPGRHRACHPDAVLGFVSSLLPEINPAAPEIGGVAWGQPGLPRWRLGVARPGSWGGLAGPQRRRRQTSQHSNVEGFPTSSR